MPVFLHKTTAGDDSAERRMMPTRKRKQAMERSALRRETARAGPPSLESLRASRGRSLVEKPEKRRITDRSAQKRKRDHMTGAVSTSAKLKSDRRRSDDRGPSELLADSISSAKRTTSKLKADRRTSASRTSMKLKDDRRRIANRGPSKLVAVGISSAEHTTSELKAERRAIACWVSMKLKSDRWGSLIGAHRYC